MIVEDHPIVRDALSQLILQNAGNEFEIAGTAGNVSEALSLLKKMSFDMAIVDISLEGADGIELIKDIRSMNYKMNILIISMFEESLYAERSLQAGADGYIMKDEEPSEILNAICTVAKGGVYFSNRIVSKFIRRKQSQSSENLVSTIDLLTDRELETFRFLGLGWKTRQIAKELHLSIKTVETYCANIRTKLKIDHFNQLITHATQWVNS